ncbi:GFA family protein [Rhizobium binxianense]
MVRHGGCLCGAVRYAVRDEPFRVGLCHCADCRKESGSSFVSFAHWPREAFTFTGDILTYGGRSFCPKCGARLFCLHDEDVEIRFGSLDDAPTQLVPRFEIWTRRREVWLRPLEGADQHDEDPPK